jgi:hypothetical protein
MKKTKKKCLKFLQCLVDSAFFYIKIMLVYKKIIKLKRIIVSKNLIINYYKNIREKNLYKNLS